MKILVDLQGLQTNSRYRGIGRYSMALVHAMARLAPAHELWVLLNGRFATTLESIEAELQPAVPPHRICILDVPDFKNFVVEENVWMAESAELLREAFIQTLAPDVVLVGSLFEGFVGGTVSAGLLPGSPPTAVMLYDLIPLLNPDLFLGDPRVRRYYMHAIESMKRADLLLAISDFSREEGIRSLHLPDDRVRAISTAPDDKFRRVEVTAEQHEAIAQKYGVRKPFIFYSGAFETRKNLAGLVQAFSRLPQDVRARFDILAVGKHIPWERAHLREAAHEVGVDDELHLFDYVPDDDLVVLFNACHLFVFPSIHEGFGLPALEAMKCGAPVIASSLTSIPEVMGLPEAMFDPRDGDAFTAKLLEGLVDEAFRERLRQNAAERAALFSWERTAGLALQALEQLAQRRVPPPSPQEIEARLLDTLGRLDRHRGAATEDQVISVARSHAENTRFALAARAAHVLPERFRWRIEGPFDSSYSLALLNRETARALQRAAHDVSLWSTEGPGDFEPDARYLEANPDLAVTYAYGRAQHPAHVDVTTRNLYPPRVTGMQSRLRLLHHYAWEESGFPAAWVDDFNTHLTGLTCLSNHVEKVLLDHGVAVPMAVSGCGVDHWDRIEPGTAPALPARGFRFLHVSSCFPRKGADVLLRAFGRAFRASDDVCLVIKTFSNPHNQVRADLAALQAADPGFPEVVILEQDLSEGDLKALYAACHALVAPSRAEGFGLPLAEALLAGLPVITTDWGGQRDFCSEQTAWLVDWAFAPARTHFDLPGSCWAEPDEASLVGRLREVRSASPEAVRERVEAGRARLRAHFSWSAVAGRLTGSVRRWSVAPEWRDMRIGWISTWNTHCGIGAYSEEMVRRLDADVHVLAAEADVRTRPDEPWVVRCWQQGGLSELTDLVRQVLGRELNTVVIQFNHWFYWYGQLTTLIRLVRARGCVVVMTMHATTDPPSDAARKLEVLLPALRLCHRILVHSVSDLNRLRKLGLTDNVCLFPLGVALPDAALLPAPQPGPRRTIASYGFFLPHKGLLELVEAVALLVQAGHDIALRLVNAEYPNEASAQAVRAAAVRIDALGLTDRVELHTDYLDDEASWRLLAGADAIVFPHQDTGESASAAARTGLAVGRPVAVTPLPIFDDLGDAVFRLPGTTPQAMADGLLALLAELAADAPAARARAEAGARWRDTHGYDALARRLHGMLLGLQRHVSWRMDASEDRVQAQVGRKTADGCESDGQAGFLMYGEYQSMPAGRYRATLFGRTGSRIGGWAFFDATIHRGSTLLARQVLREPQLSGPIATIDFELRSPAADVEFRARVDEGTDLTVTHVVVVPVTGDNLPAWR